MAQVSQLSPELTRGLLQLARALLAAARNWTLYPPEHPTVAASVSRLQDSHPLACAGKLAGSHQSGSASADDQEIRQM